MIVRVVQLFKGHKILIQGFNAFLPRTHHIDPVVAETGILPPHLMQVAASMGISLTSQGVPVSLPSISGPPPPAVYPQHWTTESLAATAGAPLSYYPSGPAAQMNGFVHQAPSSIPPPRSYQSSVPPTAAVGGTATVPVSPVPLAAGPSGFASPTAAPTAAVGGTAAAPPAAISKKSSAQFVRAISYVKKIKHRFAGEPETYKTFLAALHSYHKEQKTIFEVYMEVATLFAEHADLLEEFVLFLPENEAAAISTRLAQAGISTGLSGPASGGSGSTAPVFSRADPKTAPASKRLAQAPLPASKAAKRARQAAGMSSRTAEESAFYERVKRFLGDKQAYAEFLKCLNLFCQDIIKLQDLVQLVHRFIGPNEELFSWFKRYIGYKNDSAVPLPIWHPENAIVNQAGELNLQACKKIGSYRIYPRSHILPLSSYRTDLGREILNDHMVSCPVFNSEDSTFIASKKNQYEEALFRCEDERFEMDLLIEYNLATIAVFEPLVRKIHVMSGEEKDSFVLNATLGGTSTVIYKKAVRKIYGDKADEVITGLQRNPAVALPVVLHRLKQKDEEWRRIQRDLNKIWREVHVKNYYKALDHQGIEFKANDRRNISSRTLVSEIESVCNEQKRAAESGDTLPIHHLEFTVKKATELAEDLSRLLRAQVKSAPIFNSNDRKAILRFFGSFLASFLALPPGPISDQVVAKDTDSQSDSSDDSAASDFEGLAAGMPIDMSDAPNAGKTGEEPGEKTHTHPHAHTHTHAPVNLQNPNVPLIHPNPVLLFANNNLYVFIRLLLMSLERMERMQSVAVAANGKPFFTEKKNVVASFLDLQGQKDELEEVPGDFYRTLLLLLRQLVCGNIDPGVFEERVRFMFGTAAYPVFTFDKLMQTLVKQIQIVLTDPACEQLVRLFDSWNSRKAPLRLSEYSARLAVENTVQGRENIYRIENAPRSGRLTIQLLERLSDANGTGSSAESRWSSYVDNFVKLESNPRYLSANSQVFLARNRRHAPAIEPSLLTVHYNLECKIAINTYKLFYVENTEDFLARMPRPKSSYVQRLQSRFEDWLRRQLSEEIGIGMDVETATDQVRALIY